MLNILASLTKHGWRETFRMLRHSENTIRKQPSNPRKKYVRIRRRDKSGRKMPAAAYQFVEVHGDNEAAKTYRRVNDGEGLGEGEVSEFVAEKKTVVGVKERKQRQRMGVGEEETNKPTRRERRDERIRVSPSANKDTRSRHHRLVGQTNCEVYAPPNRSSRRHASNENSSVEMSHLFRRAKSGTRASPCSRRSNSKAQEIVDEDGTTSPFSQPEMNKRDSHTFVFGEDALTSLTQSALDEGNAMPTEPSIRANNAESSGVSNMKSSNSDLSQSSERAKYESDSLPRGTVLPELQHLTGRRTVVMTASRRNPRRGAGERMAVGRGANEQVYLRRGNGER